MATYIFYVHIYFAH